MKVFEVTTNYSHPMLVVSERASKIMDEYDNGKDREVFGVEPLGEVDKIITKKEVS